MMKQQLPNPRRRGIETLIHIIVWGIVIGFPFLMMTRSGFNISLADYLRHGSSSTLSFFLVFYIIPLPFTLYFIIILYFCTKRE